MKLLLLRRLPLLVLAVAGLMVLTIDSKSQDKDKDEIQAGTEGDVIELLETDTVPKKWRDKRWRLFKGKYSTVKFGGGFLYEYAGFSQDRIARQQMDSLGKTAEGAFSVRDFRIVINGKLKTKRTITWKLGFMYDGVTDQWFVRESGIMIGVPKWGGSFFVGRTKEGFSMNKVMVGYAGWTMERQMAIDVIPILADGVKWLGYLPKPRIFWNAGIYNDYFSHIQSFSTFKWQTSLRTGWLPIYSPETGKVLHLGINYRHGAPVNGSFRMKSKPEANTAPQFIDTGTFPSDYSNHIGGEAYYISGPWMFGSEVYAHHFHSPTTGNPVFVGGDMVASWIITGESRPYHPTNAIIGFVPVRRPVFKGGPGAWEVLMRFSTLDLNGGTLKGGKFWRLTPMVNWYLSKDVRLEMAYGYGVLDRFNLRGVTQFYQVRLQLTLL